MAFSEASHQRFSPDIGVSSPPSSVNGSAIKAKIDAISTSVKLNR